MNSKTFKINRAKLISLLYPSYTPLILFSAGSYIPFAETDVKSAEYESDRGTLNLMGYMASNGYLNYGLAKTNEYRKVGVANTSVAR